MGKANISNKLQFSAGENKLTHSSHILAKNGHHKLFSFFIFFLLPLLELWLQGTLLKLTSLASFSNFSMLRLSIPPHLWIKWPVVVDFPESTWPMTTMLIWVFSLAIVAPWYLVISPTSWGGRTASGPCKSISRRFLTNDSLWTMPW